VKYTHYAQRITLLRFGPISTAADGPLYEQVTAAIMREIAAGRLKPGDPLPSIRRLATDLLVSVITIKRAYDELEQVGIIYSRQGVGALSRRARRPCWARTRWRMSKPTFAPPSMPPVLRALPNRNCFNCFANS
jgi:DNA-binding transcriptional regulator YhcF (GntR family)